MTAEIRIGNNKYLCDFTKPLDISIPLANGQSPCAFGVNPIKFKAFTAGSYIGSIEEGSPVNFYDIKLNPHGNTTHTESVLHIDNNGKTINKILIINHIAAYLITVHAEKTEEGDHVITKSSYDWEKIPFDNIDALIIRTLPNTDDKKLKNYTGTNPPYLDERIAHMLGAKIDHLLIDLPSVDREKDEGKLLAHKALWKTESEDKGVNTITELIFVNSEIKDGLYLLCLEILPLEMDVSPSRPVLYALDEL